MCGKFLTEIENNFALQNAIHNVSFNSLLHTCTELSQYLLETISFSCSLMVQKVEECDYFLCPVKRTS